MNVSQQIRIYVDQHQRILELEQENERLELQLKRSMLQTDRAIETADGWEKLYHRASEAHAADLDERIYEPTAEVTVSGLTFIAEKRRRTNYERPDQDKHAD